MFALCQFYYAFASKFSYRSLYNDWYQAFYNIIFTSLLIPAVSVDNTDFDVNASYYIKGNIMEAYAYF